MMTAAASSHDRGLCFSSVLSSFPVLCISLVSVPSSWISRESVVSDMLNVVESSSATIELTSSPQSEREVGGDYVALMDFDAFGEDAPDQLPCDAHFAAGYDRERFQSFCGERGYHSCWRRTELAFVPNWGDSQYVLWTWVLDLNQQKPEVIDEKRMKVKRKVMVMEDGNDLTAFYIAFGTCLLADWLD
ncbi:hypothetical protein AKJ16_DCAP10795 [Drosera capensis]